MALPPQDSYNRQGPTQRTPSNGPSGTQYAQYQIPHPPVNGFGQLNGNAHQATAQHDSRYGQINGTSQHRPTLPPQQTPQRAYAVPIPPPPLSMNSSKVSTGSPSVPQPSPHVPPLDYQLLLLSLAEEYLAAAYGHGSMADIVRRETELEEYYKLIATGLGCLEAVLRHCKVAPEREAIVRLRYATVLYEETDNAMEAEEALSKGISLCDRHRFFDLKYDMQHLLARILFQKTPRAAFKFLDGIMKDAEAYQHIAWVYAFRFMKVSLHLELSSHQDLVAALAQLRSIAAMSNDFGDRTILAIATTMEGLTCLRVANDAESIEQAQRALASVRSLQLHPKVAELHQLAVLTSYVDLCCQLQNFDPKQALEKCQVMQSALKGVEESNSWTSDGSFAIPIPSARMPSCKSRCGVIRKEEDGSLVLMFNWMPKEDIYTVGYLLSGVAMGHRNMIDGQKSEHMLEEGIQRLYWADREASKTPKSITLTSTQQRWREEITLYMRLHLAFTLCRRTSWTAAGQQQAEIDRALAAMINPPEPLLLLSAYLEGVICQGTGDISGALSAYQSATLSIHEYRKTSHPSHIHLDVSLLSALNLLFIIRTPTHPDHHTLPSLVSFIEHLCLRNPNRQIQSAFNLVSATIVESSTILHTKQALQNALGLAKATDNKHLICIVLTFMSWKFFKGVVGEQAEKSARASQAQAQQCKDALWTSVSAGVLGDTLEAAGRIEEAKRARASGIMFAGSLPEGLRELMRSDPGMTKAADVASTDVRV